MNLNSLKISKCGKIKLLKHYLKLIAKKGYKKMSKIFKVEGYKDI